MTPIRPNASMHSLPSWDTVGGRGAFHQPVWRARRDSNPRPLVPKTSALSAELRAQSPFLQNKNRKFNRSTGPALIYSSTDFAVDLMIGI